MEMAVVKTSEMSWEQLDWAVAKILDGHLDVYGWKICSSIFNRHPCVSRAIKADDGVTGYEERCFNPALSWVDGGPIIARHLISVYYIPEDGPAAEGKWVASICTGDEFCGTTPLIAAMRALVAAKLGNEVEVPAPACGKQRKPS